MKLSEKRIWEQEIGRLVDGLLEHPSDADCVKKELLGKMVTSVRRNRPEPSSRTSDTELNDMWDNMPV